MSSKKQCPSVVPETPEMTNRRRSSRRSTIVSTMASMALVNKIAATPDSSQDCSKSEKKTFIEESPFSKNDASPVGALSKRAAELGISESPGDSCVGNVISFHPVFVKPKAARKSRRLSTFEELVPATQDPGENLTPVSKVQAWLNDEQNSQSPIISGKKGRRRSSVQGVAKFMLDRPSCSKSKNDSSTDDFESELAQIAKGKSMFSTQSSTSECKALRSEVEGIIESLDENEDIPSLPDFSSDSAKLLLARFESGKGSLTPAGKSSNEATSPLKIRKTRSLEPQPQKAQEDLSHILKGVVAFVEVRSKNENRSDVVVDQLVALGATIAPKLSTSCTHVVFKEGGLATYTRAKKMGLHIVSVNWILGCKKALEKLPEEKYPPMNQEKYDSPGLFPKLRKGKSMQPKSDEEFAKLIDAKTKRIFRKRLADSDSPLPGSPAVPSSISPKLPKRSRSCILDTLKEYEEAERQSPRSPASSCSSEEINTPLLKRIARRLFKAKQDASPSPSQEKSEIFSYPGINDASSCVNELEISNDVPEEPVSISGAQCVEKPQEITEDVSNDQPLREIPLANVAKIRPSPSSPKRRPRKSMSKVIKKKKLYTQTDILSETPSGTPELQPQSTLTTKRRGKTRLVKKNSMIIACPPTTSKEKENDPAPVQVCTQFKKPLGEKNESSAKSKRIVRSLCQSRRSSIDFMPVIEAKGGTTLTLPFKEIVLTSCSTEDINLAQKLAKKLPGRAKVSTRVTSSTTHVISGTEKRTLNLLRAILRGCWILSTSWILASLEADSWVDEEAYELVTFSAAVKARRLEREAFSLKSDLLKDIGSIYIGRKCKVPKKDLADLIQLAGGKAVNQVRLAQVLLGHDYIDNPSLTQVHEKWILDSIQQHCPLPFNDYVVE